MCIIWVWILPAYCSPRTKSKHKFIMCKGYTGQNPYKTLTRFFIHILNKFSCCIGPCSTMPRNVSAGMSCCYSYAGFYMIPPPACLLSKKQFRNVGVFICTIRTRFITEWLITASQQAPGEHPSIHPVVLNYPTVRLIDYYTVMIKQNLHTLAMLSICFCLQEKLQLLI